MHACGFCVFVIRYDDWISFYGESGRYQFHAYQCVIKVLSESVCDFVCHVVGMPNGTINLNELWLCKHAHLHVYRFYPTQCMMRVHVCLCACLDVHIGMLACMSHSLSLREEVAVYMKAV